MAVKHSVNFRFQIQEVSKSHGMHFKVRNSYYFKPAEKNERFLITMFQRRPLSFSAFSKTPGTVSG